MWVLAINLFLSGQISQVCPVGQRCAICLLNSSEGAITLSPQSQNACGYLLLELTWSYKLGFTYDTTEHREQFSTKKDLLEAYSRINYIDVLP